MSEIIVKKKSSGSLDFSKKARLARLDVLEHRYNKVCDSITNNKYDDIEILKADRELVSDEITFSFDNQASYFN